MGLELLGSDTERREGTLLGRSVAEEAEFVWLRGALVVASDEFTKGVSWSSISSGVGGIEFGSAILQWREGGTNVRVCVFFVGE